MGQEKPYLCVHGHFYQPPRDDPFTGKYRDEPSAAPYRNWNERITAECYGPNAAAGNFGRMSFNLGGTLARWMALNAPEAYSQIVSSVRDYRRRFDVGNGVAQSVHHTIMPLARERDKRCQIRWGIASYEHRFGHRPDGIWLPEMAVDVETLEAVVEAGLWFVILSDEQVQGDLSHGAGPYKVRLSRNRFITIFVRDRGMSNYLSFNMPSPEYSRDWINDVMHWRKRGSLTLIATDGETFGHHHRHGVDVLTNLTTPTFRDAYEITTLGKYLREHPPVNELEVIENSSWSCGHSLGRWATGCGCTPGCAYWKGALRRALDNLSRAIDEIYVAEVSRRDLPAWALRDDYISVVLGQVDGPTFLAEHGLGHLSTLAQQRILGLLEAQLYRQRMFVSCSFFFEDLERLEPRYAIANAVKSLALVRYAAGDDLTGAFRRDLSIAISPRTGRNGAQILDEVLAQARLGDSPLGGAMESMRPAQEEGGAPKEEPLVAAPPEELPAETGTDVAGS